jgi:hypothetical protein
MSSEYPFYKIGHTDDSVVRHIDPSEFDANASPEITERLNKFAQTVKAIAPRSDDFLYFSIIFLKSAEVSTIDDYGNIRKVGKEDAWGYFDDNWKWHGNVKPHKNNNNDIFPSSELRKAARSWIGCPLCVDHKSDSVDGVRGIILDAHYDSKLMQVVGLCALDKVTYPDLAKKVQNGIVRYGSMGTAVSTSVCSECGNKAASPKEYCDHIVRKQAWGEINVGLKPIEYSLVVQPAEPGAILLRCFASIQKHEGELKSYGVDTEDLYRSLDEKNASDLDVLLNSVCGASGCTLDERRRIVKGFLNTNGFTKVASITSEEGRNIGETADNLANAVDEGIVDQNTAKEVVEQMIQSADGEAPSQGDSISGTSMNSGAPPANQTIGTAVGGAVVAKPTDLGPGETNFTQDDILAVDNNPLANQAKDKKTTKLSSIMEEIMNEARLRKRAELRRRLAYHQGGSEGIEPKGFKSEDYHKYWEDDKQMHQDKSMGGADKLFPGDEALKEQLKRAQEERASKKIAYHFGGSEGIEPKTFKSEDYHKYWEDDKQMHQDKSMGGSSGMFPGDQKIKEMQKRAGYNGPALSTKFKQRRFVDGTINKAASCFEVYAGDKLVIAATAKDIFGPKLEANWSWITSKDYAKTVIAEIRENGLDYVGNLLTKRAQAAPPAPEPMPAPDAAAPPAEPAAAPPAAPMDMGMEEGAEEGAEKDPKAVIEDALVVMEDNIEKVREALSELGGGEVKVDIDVDKGGVDVEGAGEKLALSRKLVGHLKTALSESTNCADELALLSESYDRARSLSPVQRRELRGLTTEALRDFSNILGQSNSLVRMASTVVTDLKKIAAKKNAPAQNISKVAAQSTDGNDLVASALELRKNRRLNLLKTARMQLVALAEEEESMAADEHQVEDMESGAGDDYVHDNSALSMLGFDEEDLMVDDEEGDEDDEEVDADEVGEAIKEHIEHLAGLLEKLEKGADPAEIMAMLESSEDEDEDEDEDEEDEDEGEEDEASYAKSPTMGHAHGIDNSSKDSSKHHMSSDAADHGAKHSMSKDPVTAKLSQDFIAKKAEEEREAYRVKLRRAYNVAMEMQRKGMIAQSRPALDRQVDEMMQFDDRAFESFKRSVASFTGNVTQVKTASDVSGLNIGVNEDGEGTSTNASGKIDAKSLASLWD